MCEVTERDDDDDDDPLARVISVDMDFANNIEHDSGSESESETETHPKVRVRMRKMIHRKFGGVPRSGPSLQKIGSMDKRHVKKHVLKTNTKTFTQMKGLVDMSFNDRSVNVSEKKYGNDRIASRGPGSILGILALNPNGNPAVAKETIVAIKPMKLSFVAHDALRKFFEGQDSHLQVGMQASCNLF